MTSSILPEALKRLGEAPVRIDWFGDIIQRTTHGATTPKVQVSCTRMSGNSQYELAPEAPVTVGIPVSLLQVVRMGDIWSSGKRVGSVPLERVTFEDVVVNDESATVIPAGHSTPGPYNSARYELPFSQFEGHREHTMSCLVRVNMGNGCVLLVPSMEIVRFYFGASGSLLANMFSGALAGNRLYSYAHKDDATGIANLTLDPKLPGVAAATVARVAFDTAAARQFRGIVNAGVKAAASRQRWYPRVSFPLKGVTTISADGVWINRAVDRAFLVYRLRSCSHPFPFTKLYYRTESSGTRRGGSGAVEKQDQASGGSALKVHLDDALATARGLAPVELPFQGEGDQDEPFPDLIAKRINRVKTSVEAGLASRRQTAVDGEVLDLGVVENSAQGVRKGDVTNPKSTHDQSISQPASMQELLTSKVVWGERSSLKYRAPMGGGAVARMDLRFGDGPAFGYWMSQLTLFLGGEPVASALVLVAEPGGARDDAELVLFKVARNRQITADKCAKLAGVFWVDDETRKQFEDEHLLLAVLTRERLARENGGVALLIVLERYFSEQDTESGPA